MEHINEHDHSHEHHEGHHHHHHHTPASAGRLLAVIAFNIIITLAEFIGGLLSGSLALVSDAWHNLSDVLSLMLGYAGEKVSQRGGGSGYTFGLKRFEVLIALVNAVSLLAIGIFIVYEAVMRFINPGVIDVSIMLPVALVGLAGNAFSILALLKNRKDNINLRAAFLHLFYDTVSSVAVIGAAIVIHFTGLFWIDLAISLLIVVMMVWSSMGIVRESLRIFMQGAPAHINPDEVYRSMLAIKDVGSIHGLHIWSVSSAEVFLSCHICLIDKGTGFPDGDDVIRKVNAMLGDVYGINHTALQIETSLICGIGGGSCCNRGGTGEKG